MVTLSVVINSIIVISLPAFFAALKMGGGGVGGGGKGPEKEKLNCK